MHMLVYRAAYLCRQVVDLAVIAAVAAGGAAIFRCQLRADLLERAVHVTRHWLRARVVGSVQSILVCPVARRSVQCAVALLMAPLPHRPHAAM